jgi:hypothetical protein
MTQLKKKLKIELQQLKARVVADVKAKINVVIKNLRKKHNIVYSSKFNCYHVKNKGIPSTARHTMKSRYNHRNASTGKRTKKVKGLPSPSSLFVKRPFDSLSLHNDVLWAVPEFEHSSARPAPLAISVAYENENFKIVDILVNKIKSRKFCFGKDG